MLSSLLLAYSLLQVTSAVKPPGYVEKPKVPDPDPPKYDYGYTIDYSAGNVQGHLEQRDGEHTEGRYYVDLPEESISQEVQYLADDWGFHPVVKYSSKSKHSSSSTQFALGEEAIKKFGSTIDKSLFSKNHVIPFGIKNKFTPIASQKSLNTIPTSPSIIESVEVLQPVIENKPLMEDIQQFPTGEPVSPQIQLINQNSLLVGETPIISLPISSTSAPLEYSKLVASTANLVSNEDLLDINGAVENLNEENSKDADVIPIFGTRRENNIFHVQPLRNSFKVENTIEKNNPNFKKPSGSGIISIETVSDGNENNSNDFSKPIVVADLNVDKEMQLNNKLQDNFNSDIYSTTHSTIEISDNGKPKIITDQRPVSQKFLAPLTVGLRLENSNKINIPDSTIKPVEDEVIEKEIMENNAKNMGLLKIFGNENNIQSQNSTYLYPINSNNDVQNIQSSTIIYQNDNSQSPNLLINENNNFVSSTTPIYLEDQLHTPNHKIQQTNNFIQHIPTIQIIETGKEYENENIQINKAILQEQQSGNVQIQSSFNLGNSLHYISNDNSNEHGNENVNNKINNQEFVQNSPNNAVIQDLTSHLQYQNNPENLILLQGVEHALQHSQTVIHESQKQNNIYNQDLNNHQVPLSIVTTNVPNNNNLLIPHDSKHDSSQNINIGQGQNLIKNEVNVNHPAQHYSSEGQILTIHPVNYVNIMNTNNGHDVSHNNAYANNIEHITNSQSQLNTHLVNLQEPLLVNFPLAQQIVFETSTHATGINTGNSHEVKVKSNNSNQVLIQDTNIKQNNLLQREQFAKKPIEYVQYINNPYPVEIKVPHPIHIPVHVHHTVPVDRIIEKKVPYPVTIEKIIEKKIPVEVKVPYPVEKIVEKIIEKPIPITQYVEKPYPVEKPIPYPVEVEKIIEKKVPVEVKVLYPVEKIVEKVVEKPITVTQYVNKPFPVTAEKIIEKKIPYAVKFELPYKTDLTKLIPNPVEHLVHKPYALHVPIAFSQLSLNSLSQQTKPLEKIPINSNIQQNLFSYAYPTNNNPELHSSQQYVFLSPITPLYYGAQNNVLFNHGYYGNPTLSIPINKNPSIPNNPLNYPKYPDSYYRKPPSSLNGVIKNIHSNSLYFNKDKKNDSYIGPVPLQESLSNWKLHEHINNHDDKLKYRRSDREGKGLRIEYGFKPPLVPSVEIDLDGKPIKRITDSN